MRRRREHKLSPVPMTPMLDVVFQLLIFFVLTFTVLLPEAQIPVNLPSKPKPVPGITTPPQTLLELRVMPGQLFLQGVSRSPQVIEGLLKDVASLNSDQTVIVKASPLARTSEVVSALDLCRGAGLPNLNLVTLR